MRGRNQSIAGRNTIAERLAALGGNYQAEAEALAKKKAEKDKNEDVEDDTIPADLSNLSDLKRFLADVFRSNSMRNTRQLEATAFVDNDHWLNYDVGGTELVTDVIEYGGWVQNPYDLVLAMSEKTVLFRTFPKNSTHDHLQVKRYNRPFDESNPECRAVCLLPPDHIFVAHNVWVSILKQSREGLMHGTPILQVEYHCINEEMRKQNPLLEFPVYAVIQCARMRYCSLLAQLPAGHPLNDPEEAAKVGVHERLLAQSVASKHEVSPHSDEAQAAAFALANAHIVTDAEQQSRAGRNPIAKPFSEVAGSSERFAIEEFGYDPNRVVQDIDTQAEHASRPVKFAECSC